MKKLYEAKQRSLEQSSIILVADVSSIPGLTSEQRKIYQELSNHQPTTIAISVSDSFLPHLPRSNGTLAFRAVPNSPLASLIKSTGCLLAPSANPKNLPPASNITEAIEYFGETVAVYVDSGEVSGAKPSQIVAFGDENQIRINQDKRRQAEANHTATHFFCKIELFSFLANLNLKRTTS